jgi:hypothetical protein
LGIQSAASLCIRCHEKRSCGRRRRGDLLSTRVLWPSINAIARLWPLPSALTARSARRSSPVGAFCLNQASSFSYPPLRLANQGHRRSRWVGRCPAAARVARDIQICRRRSGLSFNHHREQHLGRCQAVWASRDGKAACVSDTFAPPGPLTTSTFASRSCASALTRVVPRPGSAVMEAAVTSPGIADHCSPSETSGGATLGRVATKVSPGT